MRRRRLPHAVGRAGPGAHVHRALAAEAEAVAALLGDARELAVDAPRLVRPAGHRRDDERRPQLLAEERHREVYVRERHVGQRVVDEAHLLEQRRARAEADVVLGAEGEVVGLAVADVRCRSWRATITRAQTVRSRPRPFHCTPGRMTRGLRRFACTPRRATCCPRRLACTPPPRPPAPQSRRQARCIEDRGRGGACSC